MMGIIVSKFGGTSMADAGCFANIRQLIGERTRRQYIILSAPGKRNAQDDKVTDLLNRSHALYAAGEDGSAPLALVHERFTEIIETLHLDIDPSELFEPLETAARHSPASAAAQGEYLCAKLFALYADLPFVDATTLIHFDHNGHILRSEIRESVRRMAARHPCAVIPGFYGSLPDGEIKTFTRGGSDITGSLVAAALNADIYENWTDVDGLMSADPAVCPDACCHPAVSYRQMHQLAKAGAQVLHPYCLEPVCEAGISTVLKNSFAPQNPGTYISNHVRGSVHCVCSQDGYRVVAYNTLSDEARNVARGLSAESYLDSSNAEFLALHTNVSIGRPVTRVCVFGLPTQLHYEASKLAYAIASLSTPDCLRILVEPTFKNSAIRILHALLMRNI